MTKVLQTKIPFWGMLAGATAAWLVFGFLFIKHADAATLYSTTNGPTTYGTVALSDDALNIPLPDGDYIVRWYSDTQETQCLVLYDALNTIHAERDITAVVGMNEETVTINEGDTTLYAFAITTLCVNSSSGANVGRVDANYGGGAVHLANAEGFGFVPAAAWENLYPSGGGSWIGDGGEADWQSALGDAWANKPTCTVITFDFLGTSSGDGVSCVGEWFAFLIVPPSTTFIDVISAPVQALIDRWPWFYVEDFLDSFTLGFRTTSSCPLIPLLGVEFFGTTLPEVDPCDWFADLATAIETSPTLESIIIALLWLGLVFWSLGVARDIFSPELHIRPDIGDIYPQFRKRN